MGLAFVAIPEKDDVSWSGRTFGGKTCFWFHEAWKRADLSQR